MREDEAVRDLKKALANDVLQHSTRLERSQSLPSLQLLHDRHLEPDAHHTTSSTSTSPEQPEEQEEGRLEFPSPQEKEESSASCEKNLNEIQQENVPLLPHANTAGAPIRKDPNNNLLPSSTLLLKPQEPPRRRHGLVQKQPFAEPGGFRRQFVLKKREELNGNEPRTPQVSGSRTSNAYSNAGAGGQHCRLGKDTVVTLKYDQGS